jgi:dihydroorotate dehydrogenase electron transfer subunit
MFQTQARVIKNIEVAPQYYKMSLDALAIVNEAHPGQFVNIRVSDSYEPLLRRPFSIHGVKTLRHQGIKVPVIEILYKVIGKGTQVLSEKRSGEKLDILGPLGNGFDYQLPITNYQLPLLVAGGMGVAPLVFLAEKLSEDRQEKTDNKIKVLVGAKSKDEILCIEDFKRLNCEIKISTDDGSGGFSGKVSGLLKDLLSTRQCRPSIIFACGPKPMLEAIAVISKKHKIPAQISLEEHMACGIGGCFGCIVDTRNGYKRVCRDGPVFNISDIKF